MRLIPGLLLLTQLAKLLKISFVVIKSSLQSCLLTEDSYQCIILSLLTPSYLSGKYVDISIELLIMVQYTACN